MSDLDHEEEQQIEREELLERRRERQIGGKPRKLGQKITLLSVGFVFVGYFTLSLLDNAMNIFGPEEIQTQSASEVDLTVATKRTRQSGLDFVGPATQQKPIVEEKIDPNIARIKALEENLNKLIEATNKPDNTSARTKAVLEEYKKQMERELEKRDANYEKLLTEERERRLELEKARIEEAKRAEEARKDAERDQQYQTAEQARIQSPSVILDGTQVKTSTAKTTANSNKTNSSKVADTSNAGAQLTAEDYDQNDRFLASAASSEFATAVSKPLDDPSRTVVQGTIVSGVLETAINTELPGNIRGQVIEPVYSYDGTRILMPAGTVVIGTFNANVKMAQNRILIAWNRAITPDGESIALGSTGADTLGRSGTAGNVNNRYRTKFGAAALISAISIVPSMISAATGSSSSGNSDSGVTVNVGGSSSNPVGDAVAGVAGAVTEQTQSVMDEYLSLPPIIQVPQGEEIRIFVNQDLVFE